MQKKKTFVFYSFRFNRQTSVKRRVPSRFIRDFFASRRRTSFFLRHDIFFSLFPPPTISCFPWHADAQRGSLPRETGRRCSGIYEPRRRKYRSTCMIFTVVSGECVSRRALSREQWPSYGRLAFSLNGVNVRLYDYALCALNNPVSKEKRRFW